MKYFINISLATIVVFLVFIVFIVYKETTYGTVSAYFNSKETDCKVTLPKNLKVVYNSYNKMYAVQIENVWGSDKKQFTCKCGWVSQFPNDFIDRYVKKWGK